MKKTRITTASLLLISMLFVLVTPAGATWQEFSFNNISEDPDLSGSQFGVIVSDVLPDPVDWPDWPGGVTLGSNQILFIILNHGPVASSIADIYFYDGTLLENPVIINGPGTSFDIPASPPILPDGDELPDGATQIFSADSDTPIVENGVNPDEWVAIILDIKDGQDYDDILGALLSDPLGLFIGLHVQGIGGNDGPSDSFLNNGPTAIKLVSFSARASGSQAALKWVTGTEISNAGFNLYRSSTKDGTRVKINAQLLAAKGDAVSGASYSFVDSPGYGTFTYWLEDVEFTGKTTLHGPLSVTITKPLRRPVYRPVSPIAR